MMSFALFVATLTAGDWDRQKAFDFLEGRQQKWAEWKPAMKKGGACVSCHTGLGYLLARQAAGEKAPRPAERALVEGVRFRVLSNPRETMLNDPGAEAILSLLALGLQRPSRNAPLSPADQAAIKGLWEAQRPEGSWSWFMNGLHPVESEHAIFYGTVIAERALAAYPKGPADRAAATHAFLNREFPRQPLHHKLAWIALGSGARQKSEVLAELWRGQAEDGGWTSQALGPWESREAAPPDAGSNAYATAWAAYTAREAGVACGDRNLKRALAWLASHQDRATGAWKAVSMNKHYPEGSLQSGFMSDMASGFATAALVSCEAR